MNFLGISVPLPGPAAPVVESVFGSLVGAVGQGVTAVGDPGIRTALSSMQDAFAKLFGQAPSALAAFALQPPAFGSGQIAANVDSNPAQALQSVQAPLQQVKNSLNTGDFTYLDKMLDTVKQLMQSDNPSDQIKAQMKMNEFSRDVELITTLLAKQRDIESKIAQNLAK